MALPVRVYHDRALGGTESHRNFPGTSSSRFGSARRALLTLLARVPLSRRKLRNSAARQNGNPLFGMTSRHELKIGSRSSPSNDQVLLNLGEANCVTREATSVRATPSCVNSRILRDLGKVMTGQPLHQHVRRADFLPRISVLGIETLFSLRNRIGEISFSSYRGKPRRA